MKSFIRYASFFGILFFFLCACNGPVTETKTDINSMTEDELRAYADKLAHKYIIVDGHVDLPYRMEVAGFMLRKTVEDVSVETKGNFDYPKAKRGGLDAPFMSIYIPSKYYFEGGAKEFADSLIDMTMQVTTTYPEMFAAANSPQEIQSNFEKGLISLPMGMENGAPIEDDLNNVSYFFDRGIRYITLTHSKDNQVADSSYDTTYTWNGISPFGEEVVAEMNRLGIMVDISHVTDSAFYDALQISKAPVIASHSSCRHYTPGFHRNMTDQMIKDLAAHGGVIHINFGSTFLSEASRKNEAMLNERMINFRTENKISENDSAYLAYYNQVGEEVGFFEDVKMAAKHIDRVVKIAGIDYVGLGSDFDGVGNTLPSGLKDVSMFPNLIYELLKMGYKEEDIEKICYKNTFRVWNEVIAKAAELQGI